MFRRIFGGESQEGSMQMASKGDYRVTFSHNCDGRCIEIHLYLLYFCLNTIAVGTATAGDDEILRYKSV